METDELLELTVDEQKDELQNLNLDQLKELREAEDRNTAVDNIDVEINKKNDSQSKRGMGEIPDDEESRELPPSKAVNTDSQTSKPDTDIDIEELHAKIEYILEKSKTVSHEGFEEYEN